MFIAICILSCFSYVFVISLPDIYLKQKKAVIDQVNELQNDKDEVGSFQYLSLLMFLTPVVIYSFTDDVGLSIFCFILAIAAYTDLTTRWIPDMLSYLLISCAVYNSAENGPVLSALSVVLFIAPALMLSAVSYVRSKSVVIASGDYYIFPSVGLMVSPEYSAFVMLTTLAISYSLKKVTTHAPLVTILYFVFILFQIYTSTIGV